jgi:hypothetical protein
MRTPPTRYGIGGLADNGPSASLKTSRNNGAGAGTVRLSGTLAFAAGATLTLQGAFAADVTLQCVLCRSSAADSTR